MHVYIPKVVMICEAGQQKSHARRKKDVLTVVEIVNAL